MKRVAVTLIMVATLSAGLWAQQSEFPKLTGPYLGQKPPSTKPEVFAAGIVSTDAHEFSCCFSPDGKEFYFARREPTLNETVVMVTELRNGVWTKPDVAPFVKKKFSFEAWVTPDNKRLYYQCGAPLSGEKGLAMNVLYVDREESGWGKPKDPGAPFNPAKAMHISSTTDGTIYTTDISGGPGSECLGIIRKANGLYGKMEKPGAPLDAQQHAMHPWIAPDESYIVFGSMRPGEAISSVLLVSFKKKDGSWREPQEIKLGMKAGQPFVTSDGKYLFFSSGERLQGDIYWVSAKVIDDLRPQEGKE